MITEAEAQAVKVGDAILTRQGEDEVTAIQTTVQGQLIMVFGNGQVTAPLSAHHKVPIFKEWPVQDGSHLRL